MNPGTIAITRLKEPRRDLLRDYVIILDGKRVGHVGVGETVELQCDPGHHALGLRIDWARSNLVEFDLLPDVRIDFQCAPSSSAWKSFSVFVRPSGYITLKRI